MASPLMVTAGRNKDVTVEVMRARDGPGNVVDICNPEVRRCSMVKEGLARQKWMAGAFGACRLGDVSAALAISPRAA